MDLTDDKSGCFRDNFVLVISTKKSGLDPGSGGLDFFQGGLESADIIFQV